MLLKYAILQGNKRKGTRYMIGLYKVLLVCTCTS